MYTVLPPPENYKAELLKSVPQTQLETTNSDKDPAGKKILIQHLCTCDVHHEARGDAQYGVPSHTVSTSCWTRQVLPSSSHNHVIAG